VSQPGNVKLREAKKALVDYRRAEAAAEKARRRYVRAIEAALAAGVTQTRLAETLGVTRQAISKRLRRSG